ncbi:MAG: META domain-containing protein [Paraprevotella sp.]|nr:META domain-containing protein [Paraprevotella sp.]
MKKIVMLLMCASLFISCDSAKKVSEGSKELMSTEWKIVKANGQAVEMGEEGQPTFALNEKEVYGATGCNNYFGTYTLEGEKLSFAQMGATQRMCVNMDAERNILLALEKVSAFKVESEKAYLYDAAGVCVMELAK